MILLALLLAGALQDSKPDRAAVDAPVKDVRLRDLTRDAETFVSLADFRDRKSVVLIFTSYRCDASLEYESRIKKLTKDFAGKDVAFLGVRSSADDDAAGMRKYAREKGFEFPFLDDPVNRIADYFGVAVTPTFYVIDPKGVLRYRGAYDEDLREARAKKSYVHDALRAVLDGKEVAVKTTRTIGCALPRAEPGKGMER